MYVKNVLYYIKFYQLLPVICQITQNNIQIGKLLFIKVTL